MSLAPRTSARRIDDVDGFPSEPGLYAVFCDMRIRGLGWDPLGGPLFVGKASDSLRRRMVREHGGDTGRSTLRRSLAALLKDELGLVARYRPTKSAPKAINFTNFSLEPDGNRMLTAWMAEHLVVAFGTGRSGQDAETGVIRELRPPLSLRQWPNPWRSEIVAARRRCANEALARYRR